MVRKIRSLPFWLMLSVLLVACDRNQEDTACVPSLANLEPTKSAKFLVDAGRITRFHAEPVSCHDSVNYGIRWTLDGEIVGYSNDYDFIACSEDAGTHALYAEAITYAATDTATVEKVVAKHGWTITVNDVSRPTPPSCYAGSIKDIQNVMMAADELDKLNKAVTCLDGYLKQYACDFKAAYASGLAKAAVLGESMYPIYQRRKSLKLADVQKIVTEKVDPIRENFTVVAQKAPDDFSFRVDGNFKIYAFRDDPNLSGDDAIYFIANGRHDKGEALFISTIMYFAYAGFSVGLANVGAIEFGLHTPDDETPVSISDRVITALEADPRFLSFYDGLDASGAPLNDGLGREGRRLMGIAQNSIVQGLSAINDTFLRIFSETHDQTDDLFRYWDCGLDSICPAICSYMSQPFNTDGQADPPEYHSVNCDGGYKDTNFNGKCDEGWKAADEGECNGKFDDGEAVGSEQLGLGDRNRPERMGPSFNLRKIIKIIDIFRENVRGPGYLDIDNIATVAADTPPKFVSGLMEGAGVPYPMLRLSEFFVTPTAIRDLVPLYDSRARQFIISWESEPFRDVGYDGVENKDEKGDGGVNPYNRVTNRDPNRDDLDPYCNPECNQYDTLPDGTQVDNDGDAKYNWGDSQYGIPKDLGVEGNFVFDFIDLPNATGAFNGVHDVGEPSEPFDDEGTINVSGKLIGKGNKKWDKADRWHKIPTGSHIGPVALQREDDPPNGTLLEQPDGLFDNYYYFLQEPTMSGVVKFIVNPHKPDQDLENASGISLPDNSRVMRFGSKVLEVASDFGVRESNAHPCEADDVKQCNHWHTPELGYQK